MTNFDQSFIPVTGDASAYKDHKDRDECTQLLVRSEALFLATKHVSTVVQSSGSPDGGCGLMFFLFLGLSSQTFA